MNTTYMQLEPIWYKTRNKFVISLKHENTIRYNNRITNYVLGSVFVPITRDVREQHRGQHVATHAKKAYVYSGLTWRKELISW